MSGDRPSRFWERLNRQHADDLETFGLDNVKRHQALRYFTWTWTWRHIRGSEQMRFLLRAAGLRTVLGCAFARADLRDRSWAGVPWSKADRWLYAFAVRILWRYAVVHGDAGVVELAEPRLGNPLPVEMGGRLISQDLANSALESSAIRRALRGHEPTSILEVGAGYGRTAYALLSLFPNATYTVVDIRPALDISRWYLTRLFPQGRIQFLSPDEVDTLPPRSIDLALSISSLQEMTAAQVEGYLQLFDRVAQGGSVYLKQWAAWRNPDDDVELRFDAYPIPSRWVETFRERAPVQTRFVQAGWSVPSA